MNVKHLLRAVLRNKGSQVLRIIIITVLFSPFLLSVLSWIVTWIGGSDSRGKAEAGSQKPGLQGDWSAQGPWKEEEFPGSVPGNVAEGCGKTERG